MANARKRISELPPLNVASLDTTFVLGISGSTTYKISINNLTSSLDGAFATDLVTNALSSSLNSKLSTSSFNQYTASAINGTISGSSQLTSSFDQRYVLSGSITQTTWDNIANKPNDIVSSSTQISALGFVTGSYTTINSFNSLTQSFNSISQSFTTISGSVGTIDFSGINVVTASYLSFTQSYTNDSSSFNNRITTEKNRIDAILSASNANGDTFAEVVSLINSVDLTNDNAFATFYTASNSRITALENSTGSYLTSLSGAISSSSQLTSSFDTRYTLSGSVQPLPSNLVSSSAQITAFGFISSSITIPAGTISGSSQLTSSFDGRYVLESETGSLQTSITNLNTFTASQSTASLVTSISNLNSFTQSFSTSVDSRFDTLEATIISGSPNYTQVLGNRRTGITSTGTSIISGSITTTGNPVQIMVTGDANPIGGAGWCRLQIFRDGNGIGNIIQVENSSNLNVPYCLNVIDTPSAGTYTYSMRTVDSMSGTFDFGEFTGPLLTVVELKTNTNLPSTNNTFTGTNTFSGSTTFRGALNVSNGVGSGGGAEGGQIDLAYAQTGTTLTGSAVALDVYQDRVRIFENSGSFRGVHIDMSKAPTGVAGELIWKTSGFVNAGTFLTLDNLKVSVTTSGIARGLSVGAVSTNFTANISGWYGYTGGGSGASAVNVAYTTTGSSSTFGWGFATEGDGSNYIINDKTNNRVYRVTLMIGSGYNNNFISIERLF